MYIQGPNKKVVQPTFTQCMKITLKRKYYTNPIPS